MAHSQLRWEAVSQFEEIDAINDGDLEKLNSILKKESIKPFNGFIMENLGILGE